MFLKLGLNKWISWHERVFGREGPPRNLRINFQKYFKSYWIDRFGYEFSLARVNLSSVFIIYFVCWVPSRCLRWAGSFFHFHLCGCIRTRIAHKHRPTFLDQLKFGCMLSGMFGWMIGCCSGRTTAHSFLMLSKIAKHHSCLYIHSKHTVAACAPHRHIKINRYKFLIEIRIHSGRWQYSIAADLIVLVYKERLYNISLSFDRAQLRAFPSFPPPPSPPTHTSH